MRQNAAPLRSKADDRILSALTYIHLVSFTVVFVLGGTTLAYWVIPPLGRVLPHVFALMRANTSLLIVLCGLSAFLSTARRSNHAVLAARILGGFVVCFASLILLKDFGLIRLPIDTLLAADAGSIYPGKVSPEAAFLFILLGVILIGLRARKSFLSHLIDIFTLLLCLAIIIFLARYFFGLSHLFILYQNNPFSIQTLVCLLFLTVLVGSRRAEYGVLAILLDNGSGGTTARLAAPIAVIVPFLIAVPKAIVVRAHPAREDIATAVAAALLSMSGVCLVLILAWRTKTFEAAIRELSLRDELTGLYNRRGFYWFGEQALQLAQRSGESFSVLFFDMDNLKHVNDKFGHEVGSELLKEMAKLLLQAFRKTDVIGRIGGDELVVAGRSTEPEMTNATRRLEEAVAEANSAPNRKYLLSYSLGSIASGDDLTVSLEELLSKADAIMYEVKRRKKHALTV